MGFRIKKEQKVSEILEKCPRAGELLAEYGLACVNCFLNRFDTLEGGAALHGMSEMQIEKMINEINGVLVEEGL